MLQIKLWYFINNKFSKLKKVYNKDTKTNKIKQSEK